MKSLIQLVIEVVEAPLTPEKAEEDVLKKAIIEFASQYLLPKPSSPELLKDPINEQIKDGRDNGKSNEEIYLDILIDEYHQNEKSAYKFAAISVETYHFIPTLFDNNSTSINEEFLIACKFLLQILEMAICEMADREKIEELLAVWNTNEETRILKAKYLYSKTKINLYNEIQKNRAIHKDVSRLLDFIEAELTNNHIRDHPLAGMLTERNELAKNPDELKKEVAAIEEIQEYKKDLSIDSTINEKTKKELLKELSNPHRRPTIRIKDYKQALNESSKTNNVFHRTNSIHNNPQYKQLMTELDKNKKNPPLPQEVNKPSVNTQAPPKDITKSTSLLNATESSQTNSSEFTSSLFSFMGEIADKIGDVKDIFFESLEEKPTAKKSSSEKIKLPGMEEADAVKKNLVATSSTPKPGSVAINASSALANNPLAPKPINNTTRQKNNFN